MSTADPLSFEWPTVRAAGAHPPLPTPHPQLTGRIWRDNKPPSPTSAKFLSVSALAHAAALAALLIPLPNVGVLNGTMPVIDVELVELPATELAADSTESSAEPQQSPASPLQPESEHELAEPEAIELLAPEPTIAALPEEPVAPASVSEPLVAPEPAPVPAQDPAPVSRTAPEPVPDIEPEPAPEPAAEPEPEVPSANHIPYPAPRLALARTGTPTYPAAAAKPAAQSAAASAPSRPAAAAGNSAAIDKYPGQVLAQLRRALRYPAAAGRVTGEVLVDFTVSANGTASAIRVARTSGHAALDQAALDTVRRAAPFPAIPAGANRASWPFTVPLAFKR